MEAWLHEPVDLACARLRWPRRHLLLGDGEHVWALVFVQPGMPCPVEALAATEPVAVGEAVAVLDREAMPLREPHRWRPVVALSAKW